VCWPLSAFMVAELGWRGACLVYAAIQLGLALPLYLLVIPRGDALQSAPTLGAHAAGSSVAAKPSALLLTTIAVTLAAAVGLGALVGPSQVAARTVEMAIARYHHPIWTKITSVSFVALGLVALWAGLPLIPVALAFYGAGIGLESIARGTLPLALFGATGYATMMGRLAMPSLFAQAAAPWVGAMLLERVGAHGTLALVASVAVLNLLLTIALALLVRRSRSLKSPQFLA
jgi:hypothetical protein